MTFSNSKWIKEALKWEVNLEGKRFEKEVEEALKDLNADVEFREDELWLEMQHQEGKW